MPGECPSDNQLAALLEGDFEPDPGLQGHLGECATCRALTGELLRSFVAHAPLPEAGARVGAYELGAELGRGGMGVVFRATDTRLRRTVAIKFLALRMRGDVDAALRFRREAQAAAALRHPNVAALFESGEHEGLSFLVFELVEGDSLTRRIGELGMRETEALPMLAQLAGGVAAAHAGGIIHRDLKPGNIMVQRDGVVKLLDFGLAKLTQDVSSSIARVTLTREVMGTLAYMAPEQQLGHADDPRVDIWAIGAVAYHMLTGRPPFGFQPAEILRAQVSAPRPLRQLRPEVSRDLETLVMRCLSEDPARRPATAQLVADDLQRISRGDPILVRPSSVGYRLQKSLRRHRTLAVVSAMALVTVTALAGYGISVRRSADERARLSRELGRSAQQIRSTLRSAHLLPLHDTRPERAVVAAQMLEVEAQLRRAGADGEAAGNLALGEGWAALGDYARARVYLEKAWAAGERSPELAAALGSTLGVLYDQAIRHSRQNGKADNREAELNRTLRDPALRYLGSVRGTGEADADYLAARIALLERRYDDAAELAERAFRRAPLSYEAGIVEALALRSQWHTLYKKEDRAAAEKSWARMREVSERVLEVARSDDWAYAELVEAEEVIHWNLAFSGADVTDLETRLFKWIEAAATANPDEPRVHRLRADLLQKRADLDQDAGKDPSALVAQGLAALKRALELDPRDWRALNLEADAYNVLADREANHNRDPEPWLQKALAALQSSASIESNPDTDDDMGVIYLSLADWKMTRGLDPREDCDRAIELDRRAAQADDDRGRHHYAGSPLRMKAAYLDRTGQDPLPTVRAAAAAYQEALAVDGAAWETSAMLANTIADEAAYRLKRGEPVEELLAQASSALARAHPESEMPQVWVVRQQIALLHAQAAMLGGNDPESWLEEVRSDGARARSLDEKEAFSPLMTAQAELLEARRAERRGISALPALERARRESEQAVAINARDVDYLAVAAEVRRRLAEWDVAHHRSPDADLAAAHALLDRALHDTQQYAPARLQRAALLRIEGKEARAREELAAARALDPRVDALELRLTEAK